MAQTTNHWKLGLFVVATLVIGVAAVVWLGLRRFNRDAFPIVTYFDESVQGLDVGSPVKFRGVLLGTVSSISVAPDHRHVEVWMQLYKDTLARMGFDPEKPRDPLLRPQLASAGITGVKFVQFDTFSPARYPESELVFTTPDRYYVPSVPSTLKSLEEVANEVLAKLPKLSDQLSDTLLEAKKSLKSLAELGTWIRSDDSGLKKTVAAIDHAARALEQTIRDAELARTTSSLRTAAGSVDSAATKLGGKSADIDETLRGLREALEAVRALAARFERDPSAIIRGRAVEARPVKPWWIALALAAGLTGCLLPDPPASPRYFAPAMAAAAGGRAAAPLAVRLGIVRSPTYLREQMTWRRSDVEYGFYEQRRWTEVPSSYVERALTRALYGTERVPVVPPDAPVLNVEVRAFDEILAPVHEARVALWLELADARCVRLRGVFDATRPLEGDDPRDVARAVGEALDEVAANVRNAVAGALADRGRCGT